MGDKLEESLTCYENALEIYQKEVKAKEGEGSTLFDGTEQSLLIRKLRCFIITNMKDIFKLDNEAFMKDFNLLAKQINASQSRFFCELLTVLGMSMFHRHKNIQSEGLFRKSIEVLEDTKTHSNLKHLDIVSHTLVLNETKGIYAELLRRAGRSIPPELTENSQLQSYVASLPFFSLLPYPLLPVSIEQHLIKQ